MTTQCTDAIVKDELDRLAANFFRAVTFEAGNAPPYDNIYALFIESGLLIKNTGATPEISTVREFIEPRAAMVRAGELTRFREVELLKPRSPLAMLLTASVRMRSLER